MPLTHLVRAAGFPWLARAPGQEFFPRPSGIQGGVSHNWDRSTATSGNSSGEP